MPSQKPFLSSEVLEDVNRQSCENSMMLVLGKFNRLVRFSGSSLRKGSLFLSTYVRVTFISRGVCRNPLDAFLKD